MLPRWYQVLWMMSHLPCCTRCPVIIIIFILLNQRNIFFINKHWIIHFILSKWPLFRFWLSWINVKNKSMGNCISKINKDRFLDLEEYFKNMTSSEKERVRPVLDIITGGRYTRIHSTEKYLKKLDPLQTGVWWRSL